MATNVWSISGTTATLKEDGVVKAKLTGLASGLSANEGAIEGITESNDTITLDNRVLGSSKVTLTLSNGGSYKLALGSGVTKAKFSDVKTEVSGTKATVKSTVEVGWYQTDDKTLTYNSDKKTDEILATVNGIKAVTTGENGNEAAVKGAISVADGSITIKKDALDTTKVSLTSSYGYKLELDEGVASPSPGEPYWTVSGTTAVYKFDTSNGYTLSSDKKNITYAAANTTTIATITGLNKNLKEYLDEGMIAGIAVAEKDETDIADEDTEEDVTDIADDDTEETIYVIRLSQNVLAESGTATLTLGNDYKGKYELALDESEDEGGVLTEKTQANVWFINETTATYNVVEKAYYTLSDKKDSVTYTPQKSLEELAKLTGLASGLLAKDDGVYAEVEGEEEEVKVIEAVEPTQDNPDTEDQNETSPGKIRLLSEFALNEKDVTFTSKKDYVLEVDTEGIAEPDIYNKGWYVEGNVATYTGDRVGGYTLSKDGKTLVYTESKEEVAIVTLTGVKQNVYISNDEDNKDIEITDELDKDNKPTGNKIITVRAGVLGTSDITVKESGYKLAFDSEIIKKLSDGTEIVTANPYGDESPSDEPEIAIEKIEKGVDTWTYSGTTAVYKKIIPAYYKIEDGVIKYVKEADFKGKDGKSIIFATITGLKSDLDINDLFYGDTPFIEFDDDNPTNIIISEGALGKENVKLDNGKDSDGKACAYTLKLEEDIAPALAKDAVTTWSVSSKNDTTTATLKGKMTEGYTLKDNQITYQKAQENGVVLTITGLAPKLTADALNKTGDDAIISFDTTSTTPKIILTSDVLGNSDVSVDNGYVLELDEDVVTSVGEEEISSVWYAEKTAGTYSYREFTPKYYTYQTQEADPNDEENLDVTDYTKIIYHKEEYSEPQVTIAGLKSNLTFDVGEYETDADADSDEDAIETAAPIAIGEDGNTVVVRASALDGKNVTITQGKDSEGNVTSFSLELADDIASSQNILESSFDKNILTIKKSTSAGYEVSEDSQKIIYTPGKAASTVAKISGLASNLTVCTDKGNEDDEDYEGDEDNFGKIGFVDGEGNFNEVLQINDEDKTITILSRDALGSSEVKFTDNSGKYKFVLGDPDSTDAPVDFTAHDADTYAWVVDKTNAYLVSYKTAGYALSSNGDKITYTAAKFGETKNALATLSGLKSGLKADINGQIDGIVIEEGTITLSKDVLGDNDITLTSSEYSLALADELDSVTQGKWSPVRNGVATYTETTTAGWEVVESEDDIGVEEGEADDTSEKIVTSTIKFTKGNVVNTEIKGLASGVKLSTTDTLNGKLVVANADGNLVEAVHVDNDDGNKIFRIMNSNALANNNVTLKNQNGVSNKLELADGLAAVTENAIWNKKSNDTKATYTQQTKAGHMRTNDTTITYLSTDKNLTLATLSGLVKGIAAENGLIAGIEVTTDDETGKDIVRVDKEVLGAQVTLNKNDKYDLALNGTEEEFAVADDPTHFNYDAKNGKATLLAGKTAGWAYKKDAAGNITDYKTLYYTKAAPKTIATVSGLKKNAETVDGKVSGLDFIEASSTDDGTIILGKNVLGTTKITLSTKEKYKFAFDTEDEEEILPKDDGKVWKSDGKGTLKYQYDTSAGYEIAAGGKSVTHTNAKTTTVATLTGLENFKMEETKLPDDEDESEKIELPTISDPKFDENGKVITAGTITIKDERLLKGKQVKLTSKDYNLALGDLGPKDFEEPQWYYKGTTATLKNGQTDGYKVASAKDNKIINYVPENASTTLVTISGLNKNIKLSTAKDIDSDGELVGAGKPGYIVKNEEIEITKTVDGKEEKQKVKKDVFHTVDEIKYDVDNKTLTLPDEFFGTTNITIKNGSGYDFKFKEDDSKKTKADDPVWTGSNGTFKLTQHVSDGFTLSEDGKTFKYSKEQKANTVIATVSGLKKDFKVATKSDVTAAGEKPGFNEGDFVSVQKVGKTVTYTKIDNILDYDDDEDKKTITVSEAALGTSKISVSGKGGYKLVLADDVKTAAEKPTEWVTEKTTATYKTYDTPYYQLDAKGAIVYKAETKGNAHLTITGLKNGASIGSESFDSDSKIISLGADQLGTSKITLKTSGDDFKDYKLGFKEDDDSISISTLKTSGSNDVGWFNKNGTATLKGRMTSGYTLAADGKSITYSKNDKALQTVATVTGLAKNVSISSGSDGVISLTADKLNKKNIKVTGDGYSLSLAESIAAPTAEINDWILKSGSATLKGTVTEGYTLAESAKSITYTTDKNRNLATIKGVKNLDSDNFKNQGTEDAFIYLKNEDLNQKVTISGGVLAVSLDADYDNANVAGSAASDNISIAGSNVSVNTGKGDDFVTFEGDGNIFFYANGDGHDVIAKFDDEKDKIKLTNSTITLANISIGDGYGDNKSDVIIKVGAGSIILEDFGDKGSITINDKSGKNTVYDLSSLVDKSAGNAYALEASDFSLTPTTLGKQGPVIYGGKDKK